VEDAMSPDKKSVPTTRESPAMRRVLEAVRRLDSELGCWEDNDTPPQQDSRDGAEEQLLQ
jgi:hypothetical protein